MKRILGRIFAACGVALVVTSLYFDYAYVAALPRNPEPEIGRIYKFSVHGTTVYITDSEYLTVNGCFYGGMVCLMVGGFLIGPRRWPLPNPLRASIEGRRWRARHEGDDSSPGPPDT